MSVYDKAKWHFGGDFPAELPQFQGYVHIGMYLGWAVEANLEGPLLAEDFVAAVAQFRAGEITGSRLLEITDGVLDDEMLSAAGNQFTESYYESEYIDDYAELFGHLPSLYHVEDTAENFEKVRERLDQRFREWQSK